MKALDRYIATAVIQNYGLMLALFLGVFSFFALAEELESIGSGQYRLQDAIAYVLSTLPGRMVDLAPMIALLGSLMGLGGIANHYELIAMQALGISPLRIGWSTIRVGLLFMLAIVVMEEFINPPLVQHAYLQRAVALSDTGTLVGENGFWFRDDLRFIRVESLRFGKIPENIDVYQFDEKGQLQTFTHARYADIQDQKQWVLNDVDQKVIGEHEIVTHHLDQLTWDSVLSTDQVETLSTPPEILSPSELYQYTKYLRETGQNPKHFELAFWQKVAQPIGAGIMVVLAIPFVFGPLRMATAGKRILLGALIAMGFYFLNQSLKQLGLILGFDPILITFGPLGVILVAALWFWRRHL